MTRDEAIKQTVAIMEAASWALDPADLEHFLDALLAECEARLDALELARIGEHCGLSPLCR